jgi:hypothetical protein
MNDMRATRKEASAVGTEAVLTQNMAAKSSRLDERPRPNGLWSALHGVFEKRCASEGRCVSSFLGWRASAQIFTDGISYAAGIGQAPG